MYEYDGMRFKFFACTFACTTTTDYYPFSWAPPRPGPSGRPRTASPSSGRIYGVQRSRSLCYDVVFDAVAYSETYSSYDAKNLYVRKL